MSGRRPINQGGKSPSEAYLEGRLAEAKAVPRAVEPEAMAPFLRVLLAN